MSNKWEVIVGNVGTVYEGSNGFKARQEYSAYVAISKKNTGRAGGESVFLMKNGEPDVEHIGPVDLQEYERSIT
jgi:hypothetical protein